jgi:hypothetical protein
MRPLPPPNRRSALDSTPLSAAVVRQTMSQITKTSASPSAAAHMRYYNFSRHWTMRIEPHLADKELTKILVKDFNKFTRSGPRRETFAQGDLPCDFEKVSWERQRRGRPGRYWRYVTSGACHWLVNFNLKLAMLSEPKHLWRIVTSQKHSTVWNGKDLLFDMNFCAFRVEPNKTWELANNNGRVLEPGKYLRVGMPVLPPPKPIVSAVSASTLQMSGNRFSGHQCAAEVRSLGDLRESAPRGCLPWTKARGFHQTRERPPRRSLCGRACRLSVE